MVRGACSNEDMHMSIKLMAMVWDDHSGNLTGIEKSILLRLADFAADNGTQIFPSLTTISQDTSHSRSTVIRTLQALESKKYIKKTNRQKNVTNITNLYRIDIDKLKKGSITVTPGVVSHRHQGSVTVTPDPSIDPSHRSINNNKAQNQPQKTEPKKSQNDVVIKLTKILKENKIEVHEKTLVSWIKAYGEKRILDSIQIMKSSKNIRNPSGWLIESLKQGFNSNMVYNHQSNPDLVSETKILISKIEENKSKVEQQKKNQIKKYGKLIGLKERLSISHV